MTLRLVVCVSGRGSNLGAVLAKIEAGELDAEVVRVVSSHLGAPQIELSPDVDLVVLDRDVALGGGEDWRVRYDDTLLDAIASARPDLVVLAGFEHVLGQRMLVELAGRVINLHPAMPGAHPGQGALERAYRSGEGSGVTVHWVSAGIDTGPVLLAEPVEHRPGESVEAFAERVHRVEHRLLPQVIQHLAENPSEIDARASAFAAPTRRALLSVSDKRDLVLLGRGLVELGFELVASGGTARTLREAAVPVTKVEALTDTPEMLGGRVKTLHPAVHGGLLARSDQLAELAAHGYAPIDLVAVNLYPFAKVIQETDDLDVQLESVDIGGVALLRAAAKNFERVTVLSSPDDYARALMLMSDGALDLAERRRLAAKAFGQTAQYDALIATQLMLAEETSETAEADELKQTDVTEGRKRRQTLRMGGPDSLLAGGLGAKDWAATGLAGANEPKRDASSGQGLRAEAEANAVGTTEEMGADFALPAHLSVELPQQVSLRYGENPHQAAAYYGGVGFRALTGKALSYNNILDADAAWEMACGFEDPTVAVVKHTNPCGLASGDSLLAAVHPAFACDEKSAFGSVVAFNGEVDADVVAELGGRFVELLVAPSFTAEAISAVRAKSKKLRAVVAPASTGLSVRSVAGGVLVQRPDAEPLDDTRFEVVCGSCDASLMRSLRFAAKVVRYVKSNAIVLTQGTATVGVGAGQMSRVDAVELAIRKAGPRASGSVLGSDAFFPFPDAIELAYQAGVTAIVQPGGSIRDGEVFEAAKRLGITMVVTGRRSFRH